MKNRKLILIIMDGWGLTVKPELSAPFQAQTPFFDSIWETQTRMSLHASGEAVGLPEGQMGNSEVGHMNIGAGRIVNQYLVRISKSIQSGEFIEELEIKKLVEYCKNNQKPLHLLGLLSDGGVHSTIHHLIGILDLLKDKNLPEIYVHAFTDGRDTDPKGGVGYVKDLEAHMEKIQVGKIASIIGRYYAMDRDKRWPRIKKAYDLLIKGEGKPFSSAEEAVLDSYEEDKTDEFIEPRIIQENGKPIATIQEGDAVLFFNFRNDRARQLTHVLSQQNMEEEGMVKRDLHYVTLTEYDSSFENIKVVFSPVELSNGLGEHLSKQGKVQVRIAETEKYPHVTYFFNGGREEPMEGEEHILCPSPKVATYDLQPEMSAYEIRNKIINIIEEKTPDFICLNFANPDMVGHTGNFEAAITACETVDECTGEVSEAALKADYVILITADHGNADIMKTAEGNPHTAHTTALVPLVLLDKHGTFQLKDMEGKLGDLAPTILSIMGLEIPQEMTGEILCETAESVGEEHSMAEGT